ncbi:uncharacterized protein LOC116769062 [Danaus plexippus]|uniref:uncharacterized protein LOC116769062 n=1 Tax=Danaus plexippus TaxID=13037 RepID=UPI002AB28092|nr:uncharacterized protein LOC116769062 [Danaus plexippus]
MKLLVLFALCALVAASAAAPRSENHEVLVYDLPRDIVPEQRNFLLNVLIRQLFNFIRDIIQNGSWLIGIPPLDPLKLESFHLVVPAGLINLDLELKNILMKGLGGFVVHKSDLSTRDLVFDLDIAFPKIDISTEVYDLTGDLLTAIPIFGNGRARFFVDKFRLRAKLYIKPSDDEKAVIIDKIEDVSFDLPTIKSEIEGAIGGGDIDNIVNAIVEDVVIDYVNRFRGAISKIGAGAVITVLNPILEKLDTWRYLKPFL